MLQVGQKLLNNETLSAAGHGRVGSPGKCWGEYLGTPKKQFVKTPRYKTYAQALAKLDIEAVKADVEKLLTDSQSCWPADFGNYGPFFVRLAWHCAGTFRITDGVGGCAGGRQRFEPEASWHDNVNLDKARALVAPIKQKYGKGLSWGDLIALAGTQALRSMGVPIKSFCFGRIDDPSGKRSLPLGPSKIQRKTAPCAGPVNGMCQDKPAKTALSPTEVGLIYVDPEGPMGKPDPMGSAREIRIVFTKMGHDDRATVALIGGGHAFGKAHGACNVKNAAGLPPNEARKLMKWPWQGKCGCGVGHDTYSIGIEGPWTTTPTLWSNEFFKLLLKKEWEPWIGPGGKFQWRMTQAPHDPLMRMTTDIALIADPIYRQIVEEFAHDMGALDAAFDEAWTNLINNGGRWVKSKRCDWPLLRAKPFMPPKRVMLHSDVDHSAYHY